MYEINLLNNLIPLLMENGYRPNIYKDNIFLKWD